MPGLVAGNVIQITLVGRLFEQEILSVFHYRLTEPSSSTDYMTAIQVFTEGMSTGTNNPTLAMLECQSPEYTLEGIRGQRVWPTRDRYYYDVVDLPGTHADPCLTPNVAAVIQKYSEGGSRKDVGSLHIGGTPNSQLVDGRWAAAYKTKLEVVATRMKALFVPPLSGAEAWMEIQGKVIGNATNRVIGTIVKDTARVMRRRTIGVGR